MLYKNIIANQIVNVVLKNNINIDKKVLQDEIMCILSNYEITTREDEGSLGVSECIELFLSSKRIEGLSNTTLYNYRLTLNHFSKRVNKSIINITTDDIRMYLNNFADMKTSTISTKISILKSFFGWLQNEEIINKNPMDKIKAPRKEQRIPKALNIEEIEMMRESCKTLRERAIIEVLYATGCRLSEIVNMNRGDIDWQNKSVKVIGKGGKERIVYLSFKAVYHLKKYLKSRKDSNIALFVSSRKPHNRLSGRSIQRDVKTVSDRTHINKNIHPHVLRHSMATNMLNNGANISAIQSLLGHSNLATTQIYAVASDEYIKDEYKKHFAQ